MAGAVAPSREIGPMADDVVKVAWLLYTRGNRSGRDEQFYIMKPEEVVIRSFYLYPTTDQAGKYECAAILKASDFSEVDRAECQFTTTSTILDNGTEIVTADESKKNGLTGFLESIKSLWNTIWDGLVNFFTGKTCRGKCSSFFDLSCHIQYICVSWILLFALLLAIFPTVTVLLWLLHQKGFFDPLYDWWDDQFGGGKRTHLKHGKDVRHPHTRHEEKDYRVHHKDRHKKRKGISHTHHHELHIHSHPALALALTDHHHHKHDRHLHAHKERSKHKNSRGSAHQGHKVRMDRPLSREVGAARGTQKLTTHHEEKEGRQYPKHHGKDHLYEMG